MIAAYDPQNKTGGLFNIDVQQWVIFFPIGSDEFAKRAGEGAALLNKQEQSTGLLN